jgi:hypothetical protein
MDRQTIETAPKDRAVWAWEEAHGYEAKVIWNGHEWECVDFRGNPLGIGFYPTHWAPSKVVLRWGEPPESPAIIGLPTH